MKTMSAAEALTVFVLIMTYIWKLRFTHPGFWLFPFAMVVVSHMARGERASTLGFRVTNFPGCIRRFGAPVIALTLAIWTAGMLAGSLRPQGFMQAAISLVWYLPWGLFQQYLLNGYFLRRFEADLSRKDAAILTSALFCAAHAPNWFLMIATLAGAFAAIWVYRRCHNLWFLGLAHATIGFTLFMVVPDSVSRHLRVGPGWFSHR
jgi:membrane protease YdiL (CAAX protease family)